MRVFTLCLAVSLLAPIASESVDGKEGASPWIATAGIIRDGGQSGAGVIPKVRIGHYRGPLDCYEIGELLGFVTRIQSIIVIIAEKALAHLRQDFWDVNNAWVEHR
jgi:hypothetical protein